MDLSHHPAIKCMMGEIDKLFQKYANDEKSIEVDITINGSIKTHWNSDESQSSYFSFDEDTYETNTLDTMSIKTTIRVKSK